MTCSIARGTTRRAAIAGAAAVAGAAILPAGAASSTLPPRLVRNMGAFRFNLRAVQGIVLELAATFEGEPDACSLARRKTLLDAMLPHLDLMDRALRRADRTATELRSAKNAFLRSIRLSRLAIAEGIEKPQFTAFSSFLLGDFTARMLKANAKLYPPDVVTPQFFGGFFDGA